MSNIAQIGNINTLYWSGSQVQKILEELVIPKATVTSVSKKDKEKAELMSVDAYPLTTRNHLKFDDQVNPAPFPSAIIIFKGGKKDE